MGDYLKYSFETIFCIILFLIPGYIINNHQRKHFPSEKKSSSDVIISYIYYSLICIGINALFIQFLSSIISAHMIGIIATFSFLLIIYFLSFLIIWFKNGVMENYFSKIPLLKKIDFKIFNSNSISEVPTAWDYKFSDTKSWRYVFVTLKDNTKICGLYSTHSFTGTESKDIYIEKLYKEKDDNTYELSENSDGIWITEDEIKCVEFRYIEGG